MFDHEPGYVDRQIGLGVPVRPVHALGVTGSAAIGIGQHHDRSHTVVIGGPLVCERERGTGAEPVVRTSGRARDEHEYRQTRMRHREIRRWNPNPASPMYEPRLGSRNTHMGDQATRRQSDVARARGLAPA